MEIELKLLLDPAEVSAFRRIPLLKQLAIAKPRVQHLTSIYFDTQDLYFRRHDAALRVRRVNDEWIQTLKGGGDVTSGLHQREEWESRVELPRPDLTALIELVGDHPIWAGALTDETLSARLVPIFTTKFRRTIWLLRTTHGDEVELVLDQGDVKLRTLRTPINEIELELKTGDPCALFDLALQLQDAVPLRVGNISKAERGYALYAPQPPTVVKAQKLILTADLTVEQGFRLIISDCLAHFQGNESGVKRGDDPESVHQMRVGLRRLRSALGLFASVAPCPDELQTEFDWLTSELGTARDWEVFAGGTLGMIADACPNEAKLVQLQQVALTVARKHRQRAAAAVDSIRYARLILGFGAWTQGARWRAPLTGTESDALAAPVKKFASQMLGRYRDKLQTRGKHLRDGTAQSRHHVRIAAKKFRYAIEFFESFYPAKPTARFLDELTILQDALGWLNDAAAADSLLEYLTRSHPKVAYGAGFVRGYLNGHLERDVRRLDKIWKKLTPITLPRRK